MIADKSGAWWYSIQGVNPEPWESPESFVRRVKGSDKLSVGHHSSRRMRLFQDSVKEEFPIQNPGFINLGTAALDVRFYLWRSVAVFENASGRVVEGNDVDATNCQKALEDALQGILYKNDTNNVQVSTWLHQAVDIEPFIIIRVELSDGECPVGHMRDVLTDNRFTINNILSHNRLSEERDIF